jgi:sulfide:quinone oxidoreductase
VVIAGGGVAALEAALAIRALSTDYVRITLLTAATEFVYRPAAILGPYTAKPPRRLSLSAFAADVNAVVERDTLASVDTARQVIRTGAHRALPYDTLLVAVGATTQPALRHAVMLDPGAPYAGLRDVIQDIDRAAIRSLAFVAPAPSWPLPIYELALLARERADEAQVKLDITIVTAETRPLEVFGSEISEAVRAMLTADEIQVVTGAQIGQLDDPLEKQLGGGESRFDRVVAVPRLEGPRVGGLPADADGFLPVNAHCQVPGAENVYAAGDATTFPVKFGAIAAQQADAAARAIVALRGTSVDSAPFDGLVHGMLLSRRHERGLYFTARLADGSTFDSRISESPTWEPGAKLAAPYLGPYLDELWAAGPRWIAGQLAWAETFARLERRVGSKG